MSRAAFLRAAFVAAMIPLAMFAISRTTATIAPPVLTVSVVERAVEVNRANRQDQITTFRRRWEPTAFMLPADQVRYISRNEETQGRVSTVAGTVPVAAKESDPLPPRHRLTKINARADICTRHKLRKVITRGGKSWRCQR